MFFGGLEDGPHICDRVAQVGSFSDKQCLDLPNLSFVSPDVDNILRMFYDSSYEYFIFSHDPHCIRNILKSHGMQFNSLSMEDCENVIAYHILQGHCVENQCSADYRPSACLALARHVHSADALSNTLVERLCEPSVLDKFPINLLRRACSGLGLRCEASHSRRKVIELLHVRREQDRHKSPKTVRDFFIQFESRRRLNLVMLAAAHGIQVEDFQTSEDVRVSIT